MLQPLDMSTWSAPILDWLCRWWFEAQMSYSLLCLFCNFPWISTLWGLFITYGGFLYLPTHSFSLDVEISSIELCFSYVHVPILQFPARKEQPFRFFIFDYLLFPLSCEDSEEWQWLYDIAIVNIEILRSTRPFQIRYKGPTRQPYLLQLSSTQTTSHLQKNLTQRE